MRIFAIDPGKTTGFVELLAWDEDMNLPTEVVMAAEIKAEFAPASVQFGKVFARLLEYSIPDVVVMESWEWRNTEHSVDANHACGVIGVVQYLCELHRIPIKMQRPIERKSVNDAMLHRAGMWLKGGEGHKREALRHGLRYLLNEHHKPTMNALLEKL